MRYQRRDVDDGVEFVLLDVPQKHQPGLQSLYWQNIGGGWRKTFVGAADHQVEAAFTNLQRLFEPALLMASGEQLVPWQEALLQVCDRLTAGGVDWWLTGSAALAVRGAPLVPGDLDLVVGDCDARRVGDLLIDGLVEPVGRAAWPLSSWWGRAVVEARVEWLGGVLPGADEPSVTDFGPAAAAALETVQWRHREIRVPPLRFQRAVQPDASSLTALP